MRKSIRWSALALAAGAVAGSALAAPTVLRASHQFPGGRGDVRDEMVQIVARDAKAAGVDLDVQVYPGAALFKASFGHLAFGGQPIFAMTEFTGRRGR